VAVVALAFAAALVVVAVILMLVARRAARQVPSLETLVGPDDATIRLDASRRVVVLDDRARDLLGWAASDLAHPGAFDARVLNDDRGSGARDVFAAGGSAFPVLYREIPVPRGSVVVIRDRRAEVALQERAAASELEAAGATQRGDELEAQGERLAGQVERLEHQLGLEAGPRGLPDALWRLELIRLHRVGWARGPAPGVDELEAPAERLSAALGAEVELVREDVGTYAELGEGVLDAELDAAFALGALRMAQELLAALAKRSDAITVTVRATADAVGLTVSCSGWSEDGDAAAALAAVAASAGDLAGSLTVTEEAGSLVADVTLPRPVS
jgi:hypothetical protein